ncbi:MAG: alpha/beta fold hydrolase [Clostridia bacterium]|nr:alpha/beta fold hydrolase [Clostridia bacterium]
MIENIVLNDREVIICHPEKPNGKWALKTEYFNAFPEVQNTLLDMGYYIAHIKNKTRWHHPSDTEARFNLAQYMSERFGVSKKCVIIGMSCGGLQGIYFASKYPQFVSCMYLDAPVVNLLSCPAGLGKGKESVFDEFQAHTGMDLITLLGYRNHPLDHLPKLAESNIPIILVSGDSDKIVPYDENGKYINDIYTENNCIIKTIIKKGGDHHPHSLTDNSPIIDFILKYDK